MNRRALAAQISSLISQLLILLVLHFPPSNPLTISNSSSTPHNFQEHLFNLLQHFLSTSDIAAYISLSRKRKRAHFQNSDAPDVDDVPGFRLGRFGRFDSFISQNPDSFKPFFNMKTSTFEWLCGLLEPLLECRDPVESPLGLPTETRLGIGLFRLATGADYPVISSRFRVSEADSRFCVKHLCRVLCTNFRFWVGFPSDTELSTVSSRFETLTGLPNCCGIISCSRFNLENATGLDLVSNVSQQETIASQIVVDSSSRILSITAGFRGNKSDLQILNSSNLCKDIEKGLILNSPTHIKVNDLDIPHYFIGNGDYTLLPWLMLPFVNPESGSIEENFNNVHSLMRCSSLQAMKTLRNWNVLSRPIKAEYKIAVAYIGACSILHNMLIAREDFSAFCDDLDNKELNDGIRVCSGGNFFVEDKAIVIRNALATSAKRMNPVESELVS